MSNNPILTIELVDDQRHLVNATTGYTWPEALNRVYPKDDSQPWTIQLTNRTDYYSTRSFNYTYYCGDGGLFSWSGSLFDCASFAVSSFLVQEKGYIVTKENARKVNQSFNVGELKTFDDTGVFKQMFSCTQASCQGPDSEEGRRLEDQFGPCGIDTNELAYNGGNPSGFLSSLEPLCLQVTREPEPDIAGPGVGPYIFDYEAVSSNWVSDHNGILFADCLGSLVHSFLNPDTSRPKGFIGRQSGTNPTSPEKKKPKTRQSA